MRIMRGFVDSNFSGRDWNLATAMVMNNETAFRSWVTEQVSSLLLANALASTSCVRQLRARVSSTM